jgi:TfoX/Sxy family transcriptional regulator of competence genes
MTPPKLGKPDADMEERFRAVAAKIPGAQLRKMFGYESFFVGGNFAAGLWQKTAVFKLSEADLAAFLKIKGARPFAPMKGRVMKHWGEAPEALAGSATQLKRWCEKAAAYAATLPPKGAPKKKPRAGK